MKRLLSIFTVLICLAFSARAEDPAKTPAVKFLEVNDGLEGARCMKIDGLMLRMARPTLKKTPVLAILDELESLYMFSFKEGKESEEKTFQSNAMKALNKYTKAGEISDDVSRMYIFLNQQEGNIFHEMVLLNVWPTTSMMVFHGDFTEESLRRMEEISRKQRAEGTGILSGMYRNGELPE